MQVSASLEMEFNILNEMFCKTYQISTNIDEASSLRPVDGVKIVEPAGFGSIEAGKQFPGLLIVVQHVCVRQG